MTKNNTETLKEISQKIKNFEDTEDVENFFRAFFTPHEVLTLCERYKLVEMLLQGMPQREISKKLDISLSQISRGSAELQFGIGKEIFPKIFKK